MLNEVNKDTVLKRDSFLNDSKNNTLSVIIRCHKIEGLPFLDEALFSLAIQNWQNVEIVIVLQNGTKKFKYEVNKLIEKHPFHKNCKFQIHVVKIPSGVDGRSALLNHGIKQATGRYLAFLDYDDVIYQHGYKTLIDQLTTGVSAVAVGGCRAAILKTDSGNWYVKTKETPFTWGKNRYDLLKNNFVPIHSYVIDRSRVDESDLYFDEGMSLLEDYEFLLRLCTKYEFDFSKLGVFVCEYRFHDSNTMPYNMCSPELTHARQVIEDRRRLLQCNIPVLDLIDLLNEGTSITERDETIASLNQFVTEQNESIASLNQFVTEQNESIASLNQSITERDETITSLNQSITEQNETIASLNQSITERDETIASLNQFVTERNETIASLNQSINDFHQKVGEYHQDVENLKNTIALRDEEIITLNLAREQVLHAFHNTRTWRLTEPFRLAAKKARRFRDLISPKHLNLDASTPTLLQDSATDELDKGKNSDR